MNMNTSTLYHCLGLHDQKVISTLYKKGEVHIKVMTKSDRLRCSNCKRLHVKKAGIKERLIRSSNIGEKSIYIHMIVQRLYCKSCGLTRQEHLSFIMPKKKYSNGFARLVQCLSRQMSIKAVARFLNVSWDIVKDILKTHLNNKYSYIPLGSLQFLAIDEISIKKGHKYLTCVYDLETGRVVFVGDGRSSDTLKPFWKKLKRAKAKIKAIAIDMSSAFIKAISTNLPDVPIIFDHFHITQHINKTIAKIRTKLYQEETVLKKKKVIKGTRWLLLKNSENINVEKGENLRLKAALDVNKPLYQAYYLKEEFRLLWYQNNREEAEIFIDNWVTMANDTDITLLKNLAKSIISHKTGILNWYKFPISTGPLEGTNNKIKTFKRQAYGYRDIEFFKLKILDSHMKTYALS